MKEYNRLKKSKMKMIEEINFKTHFLIKMINYQVIAFQVKILELNKIKNQ